MLERGWGVLYRDLGGNVGMIQLQLKSRDLTTQHAPFAVGVWVEGRLTFKKFTHTY